MPRRDASKGKVIAAKLQATLAAAGRLQGEGDSCEAGAEFALESQPLGDLEDVERSVQETTVEDIEGNGDRAVVTYPSGNQQPLIETRDGWLFSGPTRESSDRK